MTLRLAPGELLAEKDLMDRAGIGRTPVREAIQRLSGEGLLQVLPRKGLMVTPLRHSDLRQLIEIRKVLESLMVVKAIERAQPGHRQALRAVATHMEAAGGDLGGFFRLDQRLDELLAAACNNHYLTKALAATHSQCRRLWYLHRYRLDLPLSSRLHGDLARAVADGNDAGAIGAVDAIIEILETLISGQDMLG